ncbi:MAG: 4Fe-4S dicluster domain-containing protein [Bacteroidales bacterium]|nr:4Fe-4S dicluster domain-containing protein [Bacteroidales bacterium]
MREIYLSGYNNFVLPFMLGMIFVLSWCIIGAIRVILQLPKEDRKRFFMSLVNPKIMLKNIRDWFCDCLFHVKLWKRNKLLGYMHSSIAFGWFMIIVIGHIEVFLYTPERVHQIWYPIFFRYFVAVTESTMKGSFFFFLMDFFLLVILSGITLAIIKRVRSRLFGMRRTTRASITDLIGLYALWSIFPLRLLAEGFTADISGGSFLTKSLNGVLHSFLSDHMNMLPTWWAYSIALGIFMCILPFSRYMHIPAEILLIPMRNAGIKVRHARKGFAKLQVYSCPSCGVCIDACPMGAVKANIKDTTVYLNRQIKRYNEKRIEEISDKCLLCGKCTALCPVGVEGDRMRIAQRSIRKYNLSPDYSNIDENMLLERCNKFVSSTNNDVSSTQNQKVLYFAGCMTALTPVISKSTQSVLQKAGIKFEMMDKDGGICCGRPMLMAGRKEQAEEMVAKNTAIIKASGADTLLLSCPICYKIFKEKYHLEGIEVIHHTEFFDRLINEGRLSIKGSDTRFVYHDPCELGRGCGVYEEPRRVIGRAGVLVEADKNGKESICCGGSLGSLTLSFERRKALTENALNNLTVASPDVIATACPLCRSTFNRYSDRPVKDIAEIIDEATRRKNR